MPPDYTMTVLIDTADLLALRESGARIALLDVRWKLGDWDGRRHYLDGHIPGAVYVDLETELAAPASPQGGRHPMPDPATLQAAARRWGVRAGDLVVAYDDVAGTSAARAWWLLRWAGVDAVRLLDGGLRAWTDAGHELETGEEEVPPGDIVLAGSGNVPTVDADGAADLAQRGVLLDARAAERFRGEVEPVDPRAGHVPGAVSAPTLENVRDDGRFRSADELRERFAALGVSQSTPVGAYCGSGVTAAHQVAALAIAGFDAALYPGSWSQWSSDPSRPVELGADNVK